MSIIDTGRHGYVKPRILLVFIVFILLFISSIMLPRILYNNNGTVIRYMYNYPYVRIRYKWINSTCLILLINGSQKVFVEKITIGNKSFIIMENIGNRIVNRTICINESNPIIYGKVYYRVDNTENYRLFMIKKNRY